MSTDASSANGPSTPPDPETSTAGKDTESSKTELDSRVQEVHASHFGACLFNLLTRERYRESPKRFSKRHDVATAMIRTMLEVEDSQGSSW